VEQDLKESNGFATRFESRDYYAYYEGSRFEKTEHELPALVVSVRELH
jgi:hypothetical protein